METMLPSDALLVEREIVQEITYDMEAMSPGFITVCKSIVPETYSILTPQNHWKDTQGRGRLHSFDPRPILEALIPTPRILATLGLHRKGLSSEQLYKARKST